MIEMTQLYLYPVKSCGGMALDTLNLVATGPQYDRNWVITDADGSFLTQREHPRMALIQPRFEDGCLVLSAPDVQPLAVPLDLSTAPHMPITVWRDTMQAADAGSDAARWLSSVIGESARLFALTNQTHRLTDPAYSAQQSQVAFPDGYPMLLIGEASLADLNAKLAARNEPPRTMRHFRPNIVVSGSGAFEEDAWTRFMIGEVAFDVVKACARCAITTVNPDTGTVDNPKEPLATLATYRKAASGGVLFGQNVIHRGHSAIHVGDKLTLMNS